MLIYKDSLPIDTMDIRKYKLPFNSIDEAKQGILHIDMQFDNPCFWYQADFNENVKNDFLIIAIGTGHDHPEIPRNQYLGSAVLCEGILVLHYFIIMCKKDKE